MDGKICQSCGFPMREEKNHGTNADGSMNEDYCAMCYRDGKFIHPEMTLEQFIEHAAKEWSDSDPSTTYGQAKEYLEKTLPTLKRWKK
jgi:hypothetical protein